MSEEIEIAARYRTHAEELRAIAAELTDPFTRRTVLKIADDYDRMASSMEAIDGTYRALGKRPNSS